MTYNQDGQKKDTWREQQLNLLGSGDEFIRVVPVRQQICGLFIVHADVVVLKQTGEEVINLPCHVEDVLNPEHEKKQMVLLTFVFEVMIVAE